MLVIHFLSLPFKTHKEQMKEKKNCIIRRQTSRKKWKKFKNWKGTRLYHMRIVEGKIFTSKNKKEE